MKKIIGTLLFFLSVIFSVLIFYPRLFQLMQAQEAPALSIDLMYNGKPISRACMWEFLGRHLFGSPEALEFIDVDCCTAREKAGEILDPDEDGSSFTWSYGGTLPHGDHIIYAYIAPYNARGKFSGLFIIRRRAHQLQVIDEILGGNRNASRIIEDSAALTGNQLTYERAMTTYDFFSTMMKLFPALEDRVINKSREKLWQGEAGYFGYGTFHVTITPAGTFETPQLISFTPAHAFCDDDKARYCQAWYDIRPSSLSMGDALEFVAGHYQCQGITTLDVSQLNEMMEEVLRYTQEE